MKWMSGNRASAVLYSFLITNGLTNKRVALPANICYLVPLTLLKAGCELVFVDLDKNWLMDRIKVIDLIVKGKIDIVFLVRTYGVATNFKDYYKAIKKINQEIIIIEDCCLAIPNLLPYLEDEVAMALYSTGDTKYVQLGYGGFAKIQEGYTSKNIQGGYEEHSLKSIDAYYDACLDKQERFVYQDGDWLDLRSFKYGLEEYFVQIKKENEFIKQHKEKINNIYQAILPSEIQLPIGYQNWRFNIIVNNKEKVLEAIRNKGLFASSHYPTACNVLAKEQFKNAKKLSNTVINLFNDRHYTEEMAYETANIIKTLLS